MTTTTFDRIVELTEEGYTVNEIAKELNKGGYTTFRGNPFTASAVQYYGKGRSTKKKTTTPTWTTGTTTTLDTIRELMTSNLSAERKTEIVKMYLTK